MTWVAEATDEQLAAGYAALGPLRLRYCPYVPTPKQEAFLRINALEAFYGGAAGGGKSFALLMAAAQYVDVPGYAALLLRSSYADLALPGALMSMASDWWSGTDARWREATRTWLFPSGAKITFGYLKREEDKRRYQSAAFQYIGFDELTHFTQTQYDYLFSRVRRPTTAVQGRSSDGVGVDDVPLRVRSASNPGGKGHGWVKARFIEAATRRGLFLPSRLRDNPDLDADSYEHALSHLGVTERARLLAGDWDVRDDGGVFQRHWFIPVEPEDAPAPVALVRAWDLAGTVPTSANPDPDYTVGVLMSRDVDGGFTIRDVRRVRQGSGAVKALGRTVAMRDGKKVRVRTEQEPGSAGKAVTDEWAAMLLGWDYRGRRATGDKVTRAGGYAAAVENGYAGEARPVRVVAAGWTEEFLDEHEAFGGAGGHDDQVDAAGLAFRELVAARPARTSVPRGHVQRQSG